MCVSLQVCADNLLVSRRTFETLGGGETLCLHLHLCVPYTPDELHCGVFPLSFTEGRERGQQ